jgi:hypothetical protein
MKTLGYNLRSAVILILLLALGLPGCSGGGGDDDSEAEAAEFLFCLLTLFLVCGARDAQPEADGPELSATVPESAAGPAIELVWKDRGADHAVSGYRVYRDGALLADIAGPGYTDSTLEADTRYCYRVAAYDESLIEAPRSEPACATTSWKLANVVSGIESPRQALALDPSARVHLAYIGSNEPGERLVSYARQQGGTWEHLDLGVVRTVFADSIAIAVDPMGAVHVGSQEQYFANLSGSWRREVRQGFNFSALAIDSLGFAHVVGAAHEGGFDHRVNTGGSWASQHVGDGEWRRLALAVDRFDSVHMAYYHYASRELRYLSNRGGNWTSEVVADAMEPVWRVDLAVDARGNAHLTYRSGESIAAASESDIAVAVSSLEYASNASGTWQRETFYYGIGVGGMSAIALDSDGRPHISYTDGAAGELRYLTVVGGDWKSTIVDSGLSITAECGLTADICGATDIGVDALGRVHIVYHRATTVIHAIRG